MSIENWIILYIGEIALLTFIFFENLCPYPPEVVAQPANRGWPGGAPLLKSQSLIIVNISPTFKSTLSIFIFLKRVRKNVAVILLKMQLL